MTGLFDSILDGVFGMDDAPWLKSGLGAAFKGFSDTESKNAAIRAKGIGDYQYNSDNRAPSTKTKPTDTLNAEEIEHMWYARLNKFANMGGSTMVKPR